MRKTLTVLFILVFLAFSLGAASLRFFSLDEPIYDEINALFVMEGKSTPTRPKPWTEVDVKMLLSEIEPSSEASKRLKESIESKFLKEKGDFSGYLDIYFSPEFLIHTNPDDFNTYQYVVSGDDLNSAFGGLSLLGVYKNNFAGLMDFDFSVASSRAEKATSGENNKFGASYPEYKGYSWYMGSNIVGLPVLSFSLNFPSRVYLAAGYDAFRVSLGRDKLKFGSGLMGDMLIGNTLPFHDYLELAFTGSKWFGYTFLLDFFTYESNFTPESNFELGNDRIPMEGVRMLILHRFDFTLFDGKLTFALNDSVMYASRSFYISPTALIPLYFLHSLFMGGNANSLATGEIEYSPIKNLSIYASLAVDDLTMPNEPALGRDNGASADGWGVMGGIRGTIPLRDDFFTLNAEFVYTSPFLYHRANYYTENSEEGKIYEQNLYFVSSLRYFDSGVKGIFQYLSYPFGSDAIAGLIRFGYEKPSIWRANFDAFFMAHGIIDKFSTIKYSDENTGKYQNTPSTSNPFDKNESGSVEYTLVFGTEASWDIYSWLKLNGSVYLISVLNKGNVSSPWVFDAQMSMGVTLTY